MEMKGIDVSVWNGNIDWNKVKASGIDFAMIRGAYETTQDKKFADNIQGALSSGIPCGVYLYSMATTTQEAIQEAEYLLTLIRPYKLIFPIAFDLEDRVQQNLTTVQRTDLVVEFCQKIAEAGYRPAVYSSLSWFDTMLDLTRLSLIDKWVAQWGAEQCSFHDCPQIWQYSNKGTVPGIVGDVDLNICYEDYIRFSQICSRPVASIIVAQQPTNPQLTAGTPVSLMNTPLYATSSAAVPFGRFTGQYWIYDGIKINNRLRITSSASKVEKKPEGLNVTGFANYKDLKELLPR